MNHDTIIQCEKIHLNDMKQMKKDNLIAKNIIINDILDAKKKWNALL